jgi:serine/threonine protein kinase
MVTRLTQLVQVHRIRRVPRQSIGQYRLQGVLGSGGSGTVYRAVHSSGEPVALKVLSAGRAMDTRAAKRLAREFETLYELAHPNVVRVIDAGVHQGAPFLVMELVEGLTLRNYLALDASSPISLSMSRSLSRSMSLGDDSESQEGTFGLDAFDEEEPSDVFPSASASDCDADEPSSSEVEPVSLLSISDAPEDALLTTARALTAEQLEQLNRPERIGRLKDAMAQLCEALMYIHGHGIVHRDLKPSNVMVDEDRQVRLMDFGLAKYLAEDAEITAGNKMVGTFRYMAPEQILGEPLDGRCDLYSLGVILYEMLGGLPPFDAKTPYELWQKVLETEAPPLLTLNARSDAQLARVAHRLIRKEPDDRFQTAEEVLEALSE